MTAAIKVIVVIIIFRIIKMIIMIMMVMIKIMTLNCLQSPHYAVNCLQYSHGQSAIVCKSRPTHQAFIMCSMLHAVWCKGRACLLLLMELKFPLFLV